MSDYLNLLRAHLPNPFYGKIAPPAAAAEIARAERARGVSFPDELRILLSECNGDGFLLLSAERIVDTAELMRDAWAGIYDTDAFLFFAENGCGDYYGYRSDGHCVTDSRIVRWEHETGESTVVAGSIAELITRYYSDEI